MTYGSTEGPAQRLQLETFTHQVLEKSSRRRAARPRQGNVSESPAGFDAMTS